MKKVFALMLALLLVSGAAFAQTEALFEPPYPVGIYNYCPSIFVEDGVTHIYYCTNESPNYVRDSVGYRSSQDGKVYSDETIVLRRGANNLQWDGVHTCDPDVIKGKFMLDGVEYNYLMAYLGCRTTNNQINEIGIAVAQNPEGPFTKLLVGNPLIEYDYNKENSGMFQWGAGQPSLISLDQAGKVMILYTYNPGDKTRVVCEKWDLSDLNNPVQLSERVDITEAGVVGRHGEQAHLANADFVYDPADGSLYLVGDGIPYLVDGDATGAPTFITSAVWVLKYSQQLQLENMMDFFVDQEGQSWSQVAMIGVEETGFPRNHNAGLLSDPYGWKPEGDELQVFHAVSLTNEPSNSLFTYRIHQWAVPLN